jgi:carboxyl-terminal processing protease
MKRFLSLTLAVSILSPTALSQQLASKKTSDAQVFEISQAKSFAAWSGMSDPMVPSATSSREVKRIVSDISEALNIIRSNHFNGSSLDVNSASKSSLEGALESLDPHSTFFDATEYREFLDEQQSEYSGIGAVIASRSRAGHTATYILSTAPGSPAALAKLAFGDKIIKVDGEDFTDRSSDEVREAVRGSAGVKVRLTVEKAATGRIETVELRRKELPQPSIKDSFILLGGIGYIGMTEGFNYTTSDELGSAIRKLRQQGAKGFVLDLRENPGGILEQAVRVAEKFLPSGSVIVSQRGRSSFDNRVWRSSNRTPEKLPLIVLVNENSASASEIVAGALQDHDRALIIGERTFGKGLVQSLFDTPYGSGLTLTTARYYTPSGRSIQRHYSDQSVYDYYNHRSEILQNERTESRTAGNRAVFGGDGIEPDLIIRSRDLTVLQEEISQAAFFFVRKMVSRKPTSETFPVVFDTASKNIPIVDDDLISEFGRFFDSFSGQPGSMEILKPEKSFIEQQLTFHLLLATRGDEIANREFISKDEPIIAAIAQLPRARELALASRRNK